MAVHHFFAPLKREFNLMNSNGSVVKNCPKVECSKNFQQLALSNIISHIGSFHDEVLKYAAEYLDLSEEDMMYVPVDDFDDGVEGINY